MDRGMPLRTTHPWSRQSPPTPRQSERASPAARRRRTHAGARGRTGCSQLHEASLRRGRGPVSSRASWCSGRCSGRCKRRRRRDSRLETRHLLACCGAALEDSVVCMEYCCARRLRSKKVCRAQQGSRLSGRPSPMAWMLCVRVGGTSDSGPSYVRWTSAGPDVARGGGGPSFDAAATSGGDCKRQPSRRRARARRGRFFQLR